MYNMLLFIIALMPGINYDHYHAVKVLCKGMTVLYMSSSLHVYRDEGIQSRIQIDYVQIYSIPIPYV